MTSEREIVAFSRMQARLVALLLRHDEPRFRQYIRALDQTPDDAPGPLRPYRDLAVLFFLRDELFEHILPRIIRRLSFESPRETVVEEPPARGRVQWERTLAATWGERPGEPPLLLHTRQRRRDFATPGNLLTVVTLLEYRAHVQQLLWGDQAVVGMQALRHPLADIVERCERALAFPQFAGIRPRAQRVLDGEEGGAAALEARVAAGAGPGENPAYAELLGWRRRLQRLQLLRRAGAPAPSPTLGANPRDDDYLYQLWIFYELADMLQAQGRLVALDTRPRQMAVRFRWGDGDHACTYELRHDQEVDRPVAQWAALPRGARVPRVRPDYSLRRIDPPPQAVVQDGQLIWREPGVIWDAKYYRERDSWHAPSPPIKRMIADLTLLGEPYGVLIFAFLREPSPPLVSADDHPVEASGPDVRTMRPHPRRDQTLVPDQAVAVRQLEPEDVSGGKVHPILCELLDEAHARLREPRVPACHGIFLDTLSVPERGGLLDRGGAPLPEAPGDLLVCPKPHIGPWRVDLVSRERHCCRDGRLCHIVGQTGAAPPVRPPRSAEELLDELQRLFAGGPDELDEATVSAVAARVEALTRRFAEVHKVQGRIGVYEHRLRDMGMARTLDRLDRAERESLALAVFLVEQLDDIRARDYSAPAIHVSSVLERVVQRQVAACPGLTGAAFPHRRPTLGTLPYMRRSPERTEGEWERLAGWVAQGWRGQVDPDDPDVQVSFDTLLDALEPIARTRNRAAHTDPLPREEYARLFRAVCQAGPARVGALNVLLLAWPAAEG